MVRNVVVMRVVQETFAGNAPGTSKAECKQACSWQHQKVVVPDVEASAAKLPSLFDANDLNDRDQKCAQDVRSDISAGARNQAGALNDFCAAP